MRIGILGGTFNPIHLGHVYIAQKYYDGLNLNKLIFMPDFIPPHKSAVSVVEAEKRLEMCRLAILDHPEFEVCDYEITERGKSYTYLTLEHLGGIYKGDELFLLMGADMFLTVQDWRNPEEIFKRAVICAAERDYNESEAIESHADKLKKMGARCVILHIEPLPLSSTEIREDIMNGKEVSRMLNPSVLSYIQENKMYEA